LKEKEEKRKRGETKKKQERLNKKKLKGDVTKKQKIRQLK